MARGSRRARSYTRDARGRFASTGTTGRKPKPARTTFRQRQAVSLARQRRQTGRLGSATREAKARLKASRQKLGANASPQQKAAVTRAARMAAALAGQRRIKAGPQAGVLRGAAARGVKKAKGVRVRNVRGDGMSKGRPGQLGRALARAEANKQRLGAKKEPSRKLDNGYAVNTEAASLYSRRSRSTSRAANLLPVSLPVNAGKKVVARRMAALRGKAPDTAKGKGKGSGTSRKRVKGGEAAPKVPPAVKAAPTRPTSKVADPLAGRIARAKTIAENNADRRVEGRLGNRRPSKKQRRSVLRAEKALLFYTDPLAAMRENNKLSPGFRMPRNLRGRLIYRKGEGYVALPKVAAPGSRRKVKGPKMAGTIAKPKGLKPGALAERRAAAKGKRRMAPGATSSDVYSRAKRTNFPTRSITPDVTDRPPLKKPAASLTRQRARAVYGNQLLKGTNIKDGSFRLDQATVRAPFGRFSTVKNPAPAKSFPSQAPLRTKKGELVARKGRASAAAAAQAARKVSAAKPKPTVNRTRKQAARAQVARSGRTIQRVASKAAPARPATQTARPSEPLIMGMTFAQIQSAQQGRGFMRGRVTGPAQKPRPTAADRKALRRYGMAGLRRQGMFGIVDRLQSSGAVIRLPRRRKR